MAISLVPVSRDEVSRILDLDESHFIDVKSSAIAPSKLTRTLSAFANADGGELFIGVEENKHARKKTWQGFPSQEDANGHIQIFDKLFPLGEDFSYEFLVPPQPRMAWCCMSPSKRREKSRSRQMVSPTSDAVHRISPPMLLMP